MRCCVITVFKVIHDGNRDRDFKPCLDLLADLGISTTFNVEDLSRNQGHDADDEYEERLISLQPMSSSTNKIINIIEEVIGSPLSLFLLMLTFITKQAGHEDYTDEKNKTWIPLVEL